VAGAQGPQGVPGAVGAQGPQGVPGVSFQGGPVFNASVGSGQVVSVTWSKVALTIEGFDTSAAFDSVGNHRFRPNVAGYYLFVAAVQSLVTAVICCGVYKNGAGAGSGSFVQLPSANPVSNHMVLLFMNGTTDYVDLWCYSSVTGSLANASLSGVLVRPA
jgi:hypothetical protein